MASNELIALSHFNRQRMVNDVVYMQKESTEGVHRRVDKKEKSPPTVRYCWPITLLFELFYFILIYSLRAELIFRRVSRGSGATC